MRGRLWKTLVLVRYYVMVLQLPGKDQGSFDKGVPIGNLHTALNKVLQLLKNIRSSLHCSRVQYHGCQFLQ